MVKLTKTEARFLTTSLQKQKIATKQKMDLVKLLNSQEAESLLSLLTLEAISTFDQTRGLSPEDCLATSAAAHKIKDIIHDLEVLKSYVPTKEESEEDVYDV